MASIAERVSAIIKEAVEAQGVELWDVRYVKEGSSYYLRVFIDKAEGINIDDCTNVSHAIDPILDEEDPISDSYYLEVCSPGIERELSSPEHFIKMMGQKIKVRLFKARDGIKEFVGILKGYDGTLTLEIDGIAVTFEKNEIAKVNLCDFE